MKISLKTISLEQANRISYEVLKHIYSKYTIECGNKTADLSISRGIFLGRKLIGVYLLKPSSFRNEIITGTTVEGICLAVLPEYRGQGFGKKLIEYSENLPFEFIIGGHDRRLNNINHWLKRRSLLHENSSSLYTYKKLASL